MSTLRRLSSTLTSGTFWAGFASGIFALLAAIAALGWVFLSEVKEGAQGIPTTVAPEMPKRETLPVYGTVPDGWTLRPVSEETISAAGKDSISFGELSDGPVVINKWATWCAPCIAEMETLQALRESSSEAVRLVLVSEEDRKAVRQFAEERDFSVPMYVAEELPQVLEGNTVPRTYVVRPDRQVVYRHVGSANWNADRVHRFLGRFEPTPTADAPSSN